ncbi:MAG: hypothetical protein M3P39_08395, partial [Actinomycetota bacterium]|nr:hypothetical protein [Actinomycetota bacterium]
MSVRRVACLGLLAAPALWGCGGREAPPPGPVDEDPRRGGTLVVLLARPDPAPDPHRVVTPGQVAVHGALFRTPYAWRPGDAERPTADLAEGPPEIAEDGRSVSVRLRAGVRFGPGGERDLRAADVEHGLERALA